MARSLKCLTGGICHVVPFRVEYRCNELGNYDILFEGLIRLRDIKTHEDLCQIRANAEDNTLEGLFIAQEDREIDLTSALTTSGLPITPAPTREARLRNATGAAGLNRTGHYVAEVFEYLVKYITDNQMNFVSDHFQTNQTTRTSQRILFTVPAQLAVAGTPWTFTYRNYFGQTIVVTGTTLGTAAGTLNDMVFRIKGDSTPNGVTQQYYENDHIKWAFIFNTGGDRIELTNDFEFELISFTGLSNALVDITPTTTTGARKLMLFTGAALRSSTVPDAILKNYSFKELFSEMHKLYNLGFSFENISNVPTLRIEPISYFIQQTQSLVSLAEVADLKYKFSDRFAVDIFSTGDGSVDDQFRAVLNGKDSWQSTSACDTVKRSLKTQWITDWQKIIQQRSTSDDNNDEKIYIVECEDTVLPGLDAQSRIYSDITYTNTAGVNIQGNIYNVFINNYSRLRNWLFSATSNLILEDKTISNDTLIKLLREYEFTHPLGYANLKILLYNSYNYIPFGSETTPNKNGWIEEFEADLLTGETNFVLLTQNQ